eukprot:scaffold5637_cov121-Isochrysis_galbana.AAC.5
MARRALICRRKNTARPVMPTNVTTHPVRRTRPRVSDIQTRRRDAVTPPLAKEEAMWRRSQRGVLLLLAPLLVGPTAPSPGGGGGRGGRAVNGLGLGCAVRGWRGRRERRASSEWAWAGLCGCRELNTCGTCTLRNNLAGRGLKKNRSSSAGRHLGGPCKKRAAKKNK